MKLVRYKYANDFGSNLTQEKCSRSEYSRLLMSEKSNWAIDKPLYESLHLSPIQKVNLNQSLLQEKIFDAHGNQLKANTNKQFSWDYHNRLSTAKTTNAHRATTKEFYLYFNSGRRNRKITEHFDSTDKTIVIQEVLYFGNLAYHTIWKGSNLRYDGEIVVNVQSNEVVHPFQKYKTLKISLNHKIKVQNIRFLCSDNTLVDDNQTTFVLDNNIESCEMLLDHKSFLKSYRSFKPYGRKAVTYGNESTFSYKYSGQELDKSNLYNYGYRYLLPDNFRWISPDPIGIQSGSLNYFSMVSNNPTTFRDAHGLKPTKSIGGFPWFSISRPSLKEQINYINRVNTALKWVQRRTMFGPEIVRAQDFEREFIKNKLSKTNPFTAHELVQIRIGARFHEFLQTPDLIGSAATKLETSYHMFSKHYVLREYETLPMHEKIGDFFVSLGFAPTNLEDGVAEPDKFAKQYSVAFRDNVPLGRRDIRTTQLQHGIWGHALQTILYHIHSAEDCISFVDMIQKSKGILPKSVRTHGFYNEKPVVYNHSPLVMEKFLTDIFSGVLDKLSHNSKPTDPGSSFGIQNYLIERNSTLGDDIKRLFPELIQEHEKAKRITHFQRF